MTKIPISPKPQVRPAQPARPTPPPGPSLPVWQDPSQRTPLLILAGLVSLLILVYSDMFSLVSAAWSEPLYSHGWIVPVFSLALLWMRWEPIRDVPARERWLGVLLLAFGLLLRLGAAYISMKPLDQLSFLPSIFGVFMMVGGFQIIRWAWPALIFLVFMLPLPTALEVNVLGWLQDKASRCSTFVLQTLGIAAFRSGNVINISGMDLLIADACSGLRMSTILAALAVAMVFLIDRPWWDKLIVLLSAIPIALIVNIIRISVTGIMYLLVGQDNAFVKHLAHDWAGYFMMPLALGILWIELQILERLTIPVEAATVKPISGARTVSVPLR